MSNEIRTGRHCVYELKVHLVFLAKYRRRVLTDRVLVDLENIFTDVCKSFDASLIEFNGEKDHVHLLVEYSPKLQLSRLVGSLKGVSARLLKSKGYSEIDRNLWGKHLWSRSYYAGSCGGVTLDVIKQYIQNQDRPVSSP